MTYLVTFSKEAFKDYQELERRGLKDKVDAILGEISEQPGHPPSKRLRGRYDHLYSRRLSSVDRIVYAIEEMPQEGYDGVVNVLRMRTHYQGMIPAIIL